MKIKTVKNIAGVALLASLAACSGSGSCPPNGSNGELSLKIEAPAQYPAGIAVTAYLTMTNTSGVDGKNLVYTVPLSTNYTGVTITPNPTGAGEDCTNIPAGKSCTFTADIPAGSKPGSFTVDATPNGSSVQNTKVAQSGKALQANNSISVTANLGLVDLPSNATTNYRYYILPEVQTITANQNDTTTVMLSVLVNQYGSDFSGFKLVDETGADINYQLVGSQQFATNSVNTYRVTIPAGKTLQHVRASSNKCNLEGKQYNKALTCSNDAEINLVKLGHGILRVEPSMFNMNESYPSQVVTLTNTGTGNVSNINYPTFNAPFSVSNNSCANITKLTPNQSCTMTINYESSNATSGQITPVFSYDDDNDVSTDPKNTEIVIPYIGKTTTPFSVLEVSPYSASLTAENSRKVFTITNLAGGNTSGVTISSWTLPTLPAPLELESTNCYAIGANGPAPSPTTKSLNVGDSCVYTIKYSSAESAGESSLAFNYNNGIDEQITNVAIDWTQKDPDTRLYIFVSNTTTTGNIGGLAAADTICNADTAKDSLTVPAGTTWKALILGNQATVKGLVYKNISERTIAVADGWNLIESGNLQHAISNTPGFVWTGGNGTESCSNWSSASASDYGSAGNAALVISSQWWSFVSSSCSSSAKLYCVQQPLPCTTCSIFTTESTVPSGNLGASWDVTDDYCMNASNKPADGLAYKAMLVGSKNGVVRQACTSVNCTTNESAENINWVLHPNTRYNWAGTTNQVFTTNQTGVAPMPIPNQGAPSSAVVWTGLNQDWTTDTTNNCNGWTSTSGSGRMGNRASQNGNFIGAITRNCSDSRQLLYCVAQ